MNAVRLTLATHEPVHVDPAQVLRVTPLTSAYVAGAWCDGAASLVTLWDGTRLPLAEPAARVEAKLERAEIGSRWWELAVLAAGCVGFGFWVLL